MTFVPGDIVVFVPPSGFRDVGVYTPQEPGHYLRGVEGGELAMYIFTPANNGTMSHAHPYVLTKLGIVRCFENHLKKLRT